MAIRTGQDHEQHDSYAALRFRDFRFLVSGGFLAGFAEDMVSVVVGWELYQRTNSAFALGLVGLVQIVPTLMLALPAGHFVDQHDRKRIAAVTMLVMSAAVGTLAVVSSTSGALALIYAALLVMGICRAFIFPAVASLMPHTVPESEYANAAAWETSLSQIATISGPAIGGIGVAVFGDEAIIYVAAAFMLLVAAGCFALIRAKFDAPVAEKMTIDSMLVGVRFVRSNRVILASIMLDMVAVLLGGATALLPIFAVDILHVGSVGLGFMRAAPAIGALLAGVIVAHRPPFRFAGRTLLFVVAGFGVATIVFGLSTNLWLSLAALFMIGAFDSISMIIRGTLVMIWTPDEMRGRVISVESVFVGISNELGAFESGVIAALLGATATVALGGIGTILVVSAIALWWPEVRRLRRLDSLGTDADIAAIEIRRLDPGASDSSPS